MMGARAQALAEQFEGVNTAVIAMVEACDDTAWRAMCTGEHWPVAFAAWHIGDGHGTIMGLISTVANGGTPPPVTAAMLDAANAQNAAMHSACSRQEALDLLRRNGAAAAEAVRRLSDEQLDRGATLDLFGGAAMSVGQMVEAVLIGHARHHLASIQAT